MTTTIKILDIPIQLMSQADLGTRLDHFLMSHEPAHIVTVNPEYVVEASRNPEFKKILLSASLATADGAGIIFVAKLLGLSARLDRRITGVALTSTLLGLAETRSIPVAILRDSDSLSSEAAIRAALARSYPKLAVTVLTEPLSSGDIASHAPRILFVNFGSPRQDFWIHDHLRAIPSVKIAIGVGGTFDFISGTMRRAPQFLRKLGLEWAWRLMLEPKRIRRILRATIVFPYRALTYRRSP